MSHSSNRSTTTSGRSSIRTKLYPNFHGNTCLAQTQSYYDLSGTSHIMHSLDIEMDSASWNPHGHSVDVLYPSGLLGGTCIAVDLFTYEAVWSGEQVEPLFILFRLIFHFFRCQSATSPLGRKDPGGEEEVLLSPRIWRPRPSPDAAPSSPAVGRCWVLTTQSLALTEATPQYSKEASGDVVFPRRFLFVNKHGSCYLKKILLGSDSTSRSGSGVKL